LGIWSFDVPIGLLNPRGLLEGIDKVGAVFLLPWLFYPGMVRE
jgi:hypothetical protein